MLKTRWSDTQKMVFTGAVLGAAAFILLYGFFPLIMTDDTWVRGGYVERDIIQHYTGWLFYRSSPLTFPLGIATKMNIPFGSYIGLSDSIPLFALLFRLVEPLLPQTFQYFGLWAFLCSILQGAFASLLLSLFTKNNRYNLLLAPLFIFAPIFLDRQMRHSSLGAQWLILFCLYLYFKHRRSGRFFSRGFILAACLSIAIHPYFTPMVFALLFALLAENALAAKKWREPLLMLAASLGATAATAFVLGVFWGQSSAGSTPYGYFSMNLNALFNPTSRGYTWSLFLPVQNQVLGNYDGFNYLGLGVLLTLAVLGVDTLLHLKKWPVLAFLQNRFGLIFVSLSLTVFAVSNQITAQGRVLAYIPLPRILLQLAENLRSSGRMFYPVWYLLVLTCCVYVLRRPKPAFQKYAVVGLAALQLLDLSPALAAKARDFRPYEPFPPVLQSTFWDYAAQNYTHIASLDAENLYSSMDLALLAIDHQMTTDDPFTARFDPAQRKTQMEQNRQEMTGDFSPDTLYITSVEATFLDYAEALQTDFYCARVDEHWFVFAPKRADMPTDTFTGTLPIQDYPFMISTYSDAVWDRGVMIENTSVVCFEDSAFARARLDDWLGFTAAGETYQLREVSYKDPGWIIVTLDRDASDLRNTPLFPLE